MHIEHWEGDKHYPEAFYTKRIHSDDAVEREIGSTMLSLIARLRSLPYGNKAWCFTSHFNLQFVNAPFGESSSATVSVVGWKSQYFIEYSMPREIAPWPNAIVRGEAHSEDEAIQMILTGMTRSGGWEIIPTPRA